jgi:hypothetical protein
MDNGECAAEAERLSWQLVWISSVLDDLGMLPIQETFPNFQSQLGMSCRRLTLS